MSRKSKMIYNVTFGAIYQLVTIVCNFILPRFFLEYYGSQVNGLVSSITHFLSFITLCECGVGAVVQSALYKPLADKDNIKLSEIVVSSNRFFRKIVYILILYTVCLGIIYPFVTIGSFDYVFTLLLIGILSFSYFAQYYMFLTYRLVLNADQLGFIQLIVHSIVLILNTVLSIMLIKLKFSVHIVKFVSSMIFLLQPIALKLVIDKHYMIDLKVKFEGEPIKQKWNGLLQHIAHVVLTNTDTVVLTFFSTLENVSVYSVYFLIVNGLKSLFLSVTSGIQALFGNMYAKGENENLYNTFSCVDWVINFVVVSVFTTAGVMAVPFVAIYTKGITDADYIQPVFAFLISAAYAFYCLRLPYNMIIRAAGHYKETQWSAVIEAIINVLLSVLFVNMYGLIGVALGTLIAMLYRTTYFAFYISKRIINRKVYKYFKNLLVDLTVIGFTALCVSKIDIMPAGYFEWIIYSCIVFAVCLLINLIINIIFYKKMFLMLKNALINKRKK